jgi:hypothetical protein
MEGPPWPSSLWSSSPTVSRLKADLVEVDWEATGLTYIAVEAVWHVGLFAACFRFKPVSRLATSGSGFIANALSTHLQRQAVMKQMPAAPPAKAVTLLNEPWKLAVAEWFVMNKFVGIPLWPAKVAFAGAISNQELIRRNSRRSDESIEQLS